MLQPVLLLDQSWSIFDYSWWEREKGVDPLLGDDFKVDRLDGVDFRFSLELRESLTFVLQTRARPESPCWMNLLIIVNVLDTDDQQVCHRKKQINPTFMTVDTSLELFPAADASQYLWDDILTLGVKLFEVELDPVPVDIFFETSIASVPFKITTKVEVRKSRVQAQPTQPRTPASRMAPCVFAHEVFRFKDAQPQERMQVLFYSNSSQHPVQLRATVALLDKSGRVLRSRTEHRLFREHLEAWYFPEFVPVSELDEDSLVRLELDQSFANNFPADHFLAGLNVEVKEKGKLVLGHRQKTSHDPKLGQDLAKMLKESGMQWSDLVLKTDSGESFTVHRALLAARSPFFEAMLTLDMAERDAVEIRLREVSSFALEHLLHFLYRDLMKNLRDLTVPQTVELYKIADRFQAARLVWICKHHLMGAVRRSNCGWLVLLLETHFDEDLASQAKDMFATEMQYRETPEFNQKYPELVGNSALEAFANYCSGKLGPVNLPILNDHSAGLPTEVPKDACNLL